MSNLFVKQQWNWVISGIALGGIFLITILLLTPVDVSSQFIELNRLFLGSNTINNNSNSTDYGFIFILSLFIGGYIASRLQRHRIHHELLQSPSVWRNRFGNSLGKRYLASFIGGTLALFGASLAGGCTSGHIINGMMQTSLSGYLFAIGAFAVAIPVAIVLYKES